MRQLALILFGFVSFSFSAVIEKEIALVEKESSADDELRTLYDEVQRRLQRAKELNNFMKRSLEVQMRHKPNGANAAFFSATKTDSDYCQTGNIINWFETLDVGNSDSATAAAEFNAATGIFTYQSAQSVPGIYYFQASFRCTMVRGLILMIY